MSLFRHVPAATSALALALSLSACGQSHPALTPVRPIGGGGVRAQALPALKADQPGAPGAPAIAGPVKALAALQYAHAAAREADAKAAFVSLVGSKVGPSGALEPGGEWRVEYFGSVVPGREPQNPYANKTYRKLVVTVSAAGEAALAISEQQGMPLGVCYMDAPLPQLDSSEILKAARRARPGDFGAPIEKMALSGQMTPQHLSRLVWKIASLAQGAERPLALDANTGEPIATSQLAR
jgi:CheY-like chemotaxis protein